MKKEIKYFSKLYSKDRFFTSIFFGGGTPSLMEPKYLEEILLHLKKYFTVDENAEVTMETNPGTVDKIKLKKFLVNVAAPITAICNSLIGII